ncbi:ATP-binding cassette domain-containing protein [Levilactobacillus wangkuiensis]|uniref:ATP-binding cassette domain-containing protein n=1 Tax=Levilactobacillus wangkuiensis TaxID=2799566 RepID=UPI0019405C5A|nr:ABC transporter ATP-binding protein [Levilactobacillus wangkuiensis]
MMITLNQIQKHYPNFTLDLTLNIPAGKITGILGPNGAGKSTLFKLLLNLDQPDHGQLSIANQPLVTWITAHREAVSTTFPDSGFNESLTITEINRLLTAFYPTTMTADFLANCHRLDLPLSQRLKNFSTGMQAKLKLLVSLSHAATLVILDEPTTGLDVTVRQTLIQMIQDYHRHYPLATILISSHIASDIDALAENIILITAGRLRLQTDAQHLRDQYGLFTVSKQKFAQLDHTLLSQYWVRNNQMTCLTPNRLAFTTIPGIQVPTVDELLLNFTEPAEEVPVA